MSSKFKTMENEFVKALDPFSSDGMFSFGKALETFHPSDECAFHQRSLLPRKT